MQTLDTVVTTQKVKLLIYGQSGAGKTIFSAGAPNPLYTSGGYKRVGCFPCIYITKAEISTLPEGRSFVHEHLGCV